ncbi:HIRAN domain-containing protein [Oceanobacter sp. 3_MG-2023]|uniref:HIRAN domain-containing protein n=1 Tax=Oceanobacter sp. 3_MG-2023 TaxID=3062622 RepID=UPI0027351CE0|nr:HIRAN domain-containing protein [Oceanobacter sp. 3_MG-2023]MDP2505406.1 HIRAN domain-containing protein [Oceanobacter sp. 3_MG-2023]
MPNHIVAGTSKEGRGQIVRDYCQPGASTTLVREPNNPHDPNAVKVMMGKHHIGYLKAPTAKRYAKHMDNGVQYSAVIDSMFMPDNSEWARVTISVTKIGSNVPPTSSAQRKNYFILKEVSSGQHATVIRKHAQPDSPCLIKADKKGKTASVYLLVPKLFGLLDWPVKIGVIQPTQHVQELLLHHQRLHARLKDLQMPDNALPTSAVAVKLTV